MEDREALNSGADAIRAGQNFDQQRLVAWMEENVPGFAGPLTVEQFRGGQSNPTYKLTTPGRAYVLRRKPPGTLLASAHAVDREYRVISALSGAGFPVPRTQGLCTDEAVIGTWFYVMDMVQGRIFWNTAFPGVAKGERALYFDAMNATIADLHNLDPAAIGLGDFGRPGNYFARQIARWSKQYLEDIDAGRDPHMDRLIEWLPDNIPPGDKVAIIHGDFRCDNMIFDANEPKVIAVLDWELSTLGHPLADFSYHAMMYRMPPALVTGLAGLDLEALGIPSEAQYTAAYCRRTGRDCIPAMDFYIAFNMFRLAAIMHGIKGRIVRGTAASDHAHATADMFEPLAALAWRQAGHADVA
jgi:aminoglycoside phosphotransferase (APT) family kinase protein